MNVESVSDTDDVSPDQGVSSVAPQNNENMDEDDWVLLKNELQEYLHRAEQTENPAYASIDMLNWINDNSRDFDKFYQLVRKEKPELLIRWRERAFDDNELNDADFIQEWVVFKNQPGSLNEQKSA